MNGIERHSRNTARYTDSRRPHGLRLLLPCLAVMFIVGTMIVSGAGSAKTKVAPPIRPTVPSADRNDGSRFFLERADRLDAMQGVPYQILTGDVQFRKQGMFMYCDSAHFNDTEGVIEAFGNVRMEQGDTLFVYADRLFYADSSRVAILYSDYGEDVRLINRDVELHTIEFKYDLALDLAYYEYGGTLFDKRNKLTSNYGEYSPSTKEANFVGNVHLVSKPSQTGSKDKENDLDIRSHSLLYNTATHVAEINSPAVITSRDGVIHTDNGYYNTEADTTVLYNRSLVIADNGNTLTADTLYYDRNAGYGIGYGAVEICDTTNRVMLTGNYGYYNELSDSAIVTGRALAIEYSRPDTLYLHADTIRTRRVISVIEKPDSGRIVNPADNPATDIAGNVSPDSIATSAPAVIELQDTTHYLIAAPRVRFYRVDLQGLCDSMIFVQRDSILHMHRHPIVWSGERQIFGNIIQVHLNDSTVDWMKLPNFGFAAERIEDGYYNQLTGKQMYATLDNGQLKHLDVSGNVEVIMLPMENDSTYNKIANATSSYMAADFDDQQLQKLKMWPETNGTFTPLYLAKKSMFYLNRFRWYETLRPVDADDVFNISREMIDLLESPEEGTANTSVSGSVMAPVADIAKPDTPDADSTDTTEDKDVPTEND